MDCHRIPPFRREEARKLLQDMLKKRVISPSKSPWASPIVLVKKKNGSLRCCVDYRKVNAVTRKVAYPIPRVDDTIDALAGSKWFSTLDLISGYWQVKVADEDKEKTAFCTADGFFEFNVMPGMSNAPATFQRRMDVVLSGLQWSTCLVYIDDLVIRGKTFEEHLQYLKEILQQLRERNLKLQPPKCHLFQRKLELLGHVVSSDDIATDPAKTKEVAQWPVPNTRREVQQFLGLAGYFRCFIQGFSTVARPLHRLTEKKVSASFRGVATETGRGTCIGLS